MEWVCALLCRSGCNDICSISITVRSARVTKELGAAGSSCHPENARQLVGTDQGLGEEKKRGKQNSTPILFDCVLPHSSERSETLLFLFFLSSFSFHFFFLFFFFVFSILPLFARLSLVRYCCSLPSFLCAAHPADWPIAVRLTRPPILPLLSFYLLFLLHLLMSFFFFSFFSLHERTGKKKIKIGPGRLSSVTRITSEIYLCT